MTQPEDPVLDGMADEFYTVLKQRGLDTKHPPQASDPPTATFFAEYNRRGGTVYTDPHEAMMALIRRVKAK